MKSAKVKKVSGSQRFRLKAKNICRKVFGNEKIGMFCKAELSAVLIYRERYQLSYREAADELLDEHIRKQLGIKAPISKSTLHRASRKLKGKARKSLLDETVRGRNPRILGVDGSGASSKRGMRWSRDKLKKQRDFRKMHIITNAGRGRQRRLIFSLRVTRGPRSDCREFPTLFRRVKVKKCRHFVGDSAYASRDNAQLVEDAKGMPFFKPRKTDTAKPMHRPAWKHMIIAYKENEEEWLEQYHPRSNVESLFSSFKRRISESLRAISWRAQRIELELRAIAYNIMQLTATR